MSFGMPWLTIMYRNGGIVCGMRGRWTLVLLLCPPLHLTSYDPSYPCVHILIHSYLYFLQTIPPFYYSRPPLSLISFYPSLPLPLPIHQITNHPSPQPLLSLQITCTHTHQIKERKKKSSPCGLNIEFIVLPPVHV